jgi:sugar/nucleoside kinase (ribokinase family)
LVEVKKFISQSQILMVNLDEAIEILGIEESKESLLRKLSKIGPKIVIITLGAEGAVGIKNGKIIRVAGKKIEAKDSTGAGDAFNSAFSAAHILGKNFKESLEWGVVNGASVVKFYGASQGLLDRNKIKEQLN